MLSSLSPSLLHKSEFVPCTDKFSPASHALLRHRHSELCLSVENAAAEMRFALLRSEESGVEGSSEDGLVPIEGVLGAGLLMVASLLLPLAFTDPLSPANVTVSPAPATEDRRGVKGSPPTDLLAKP